ncbi:hypothetical protein COO60DRAFT_1643797 [Scenedesmus sp. NREL 46B-D3]|nr:hypothetical protein COO60DRAFT_1643797 [Scenedesmus sp. NREL 46B-D3]
MNSDPALLCLSELMGICADFCPCTIDIGLAAAAPYPLVRLASAAGSNLATYTFRPPSASPAHPFVIESSWHAAKTGDEQGYTNSIAALMLGKAMLSTASCS